jgi:hypothetical protein
MGNSYFVLTVAFLQQVPTADSEALGELSSKSFATNRATGVKIIVGRRRETEYSSSASVRHRE